MVLLSLLLLLWSTVPVRSSFVVSYCYSWGGSGMFSLTFCGLTFSFGLSGGKSLVFLTWIIFIWTALFSFLSFSGLLAWGKIVRKLSYSLDKLEIPTYFSLKNHPKGETNFNTWLTKKVRKKYSWRNIEEEVLAKEVFVYLFNTVPAFPWISPISLSFLASKCWRFNPHNHLATATYEILQPLSMSHCNVT